jgi:glycosyltransferase involved in cell wall biosynthesis
MTGREIPALSVIIACRNGAATLGETLAGLAAQHWHRPWEIVLADNGSTDGSVACFEAAARAHPQIAMRVLDAAAERGKPFALNTAIADVRAPAVAFCDADDVPGAGWLAAMGDALETHAIVACRIDFDRLNSGWIRRSRGALQHTGLEPLAFLPGLVHAGGGTMGLQCRLVDEIGGFDPGFAYLEDTEFSLRAQLAGHRIHFVPDAVMHVRARDDLSPIFRQSYNWGRYEMKLVSRYRDRGVPFEGGWRHYAATWKRLLRNHLRKGLRPDPETMLNAAWLRAGAGRLSGQLAGMLHYRVPPYRPVPRISGG